MYRMFEYDEIWLNCVFFFLDQPVTFFALFMKFSSGDSRGQEEYRDYELLTSTQACANKENELASPSFFGNSHHLLF